MDKKEIQRKRMMGYFIDAAKKIILEEGVKNVTARKVADLAGYSYATIYNYFKDLDALLYYCIVEFLNECYEYIMSHEHPESGEARIESMVVRYMEYFIKYPQAFHLIFVEELAGEVPEELAQDIHNPKIGTLLVEALTGFAASDPGKQTDILTLGELIVNFIHGKLLFYFKRVLQKDDEELMKDIRRELNYLLLLN